MPNSSRREFVGWAALAALAAAARLRGSEDEDALRGTDPDRLGPYRLGREIFRNPLAGEADVRGSRLEGQARIGFPRGRLRLENALDPALKQKSNFVYWLPRPAPASFAAAWDFWPIREPGLCMMLFAARGRRGQDLFDPALARRTGEYDQYNRGDIDLLHLSYFRRLKRTPRSFHVCNLRKSYGFHLVAEGADPLPDVADAVSPYRMVLIKLGAEVAFYINHLEVLRWVDDGRSYGPPLGGGYLGLRQMAPMAAEYANLAVREVTRPGP